ncbi:SDR family NAD(P)-dependent oxidoreductase [Streptomyces sp. KM273126]|uniref:SDR family NAD(P)-dependent oxidoreductase n=1 Tax=Streptomyces sp. KM273126 TaxID=2545247 RepID=UPI001038957B|nr:SDR family NAD(P)-dependent oxidoreductase [Streptomyces sp. KM273126]MBA2813722.1 SDR family NAD(P)-dependent oxidoreductase [Streptomyces sp. KM273126]
MSDLFDLSGTTAVVTGSSRGVGLAIARTLLAQGARVLINGYDRAGTDTTLKALREQYPHSPDARRRVTRLAGDVTDVAVAGRAVGAMGRAPHPGHGGDTPLSRFSSRSP